LYLVIFAFKLNINAPIVPNGTSFTPYLFSTHRMFLSEQTNSLIVNFAN